MEERIHKLRELLMESEKIAGFLSSDVSGQRLPADFATGVDGCRLSILSAQRWAHLLELQWRAVCLGVKL